MRPLCCCLRNAGSGCWLPLGDGWRSLACSKSPTALPDGVAALGLPTSVEEEEEGGVAPPRGAVSLKGWGTAPKALREGAMEGSSDGRSSNGSSEMAMMAASVMQVSCGRQKGGWAFETPKKSLLKKQQ